MRRSSNSPRYFAPATSAPTSSAHTRLPFQPSGHVPGDDPLREPFGDRRLPHAGLADQHRIVLRPARQHLDRATDLLVPPDHRIELPRLGERREVTAVLLERLVRALGSLGRDALSSAAPAGGRRAALRAARRRVPATGARPTRTRRQAPGPRRKPCRARGGTRWTPAAACLRRRPRAAARGALPPRREAHPARPPARSTSVRGSSWSTSAMVRWSRSDLGVPHPASQLLCGLPQPRRS